VNSSEYPHTEIGALAVYLHTENENGITMKYRLSYWEKTAFYNQVDVVVIGSGIVGLCSAIFLKRQCPDKQIYVFERGAGPIGASTRNAGFACLGSPSEIMADIDKNGFQKAMDLIAMRWEGLIKIRELLGDASIDFKMEGGYELFTEYDDDVYQRCAFFLPELNIEMARITGFDQCYQERHNQIKQFQLGGAERLIYTQAEGQLDPGKMMVRLMAIAENLGIKIMNGIDVARITDTSAGVEIETAFGWKLTVEKVIVATNGFTENLISGMDVKPVRNLVLITQPIPGLKLNGSFHYQEGYYYFRNVENRILLGGGRNLDFEAEATQEFGINERIRSALSQFLRTIVSRDLHAEPEMWWSGILGVGKEKSPIIKWHSENIATAVRMGGMGVAIGSLVGEQVAGMVAKKL
jgi:gamma-glutamylputrescine oxidase